MEKQKKSPEQLEAERIEMDRLRTKLLQLTDMCPKAVLEGSYQKAVAWKKAAVDGRKLAESKNPTLAKLQNAMAHLNPYCA